MKKLLYIIPILLLLAMSPSFGFATDYYVKNGGNDAASGLDDDNAWETIAKINGESFSGDDIIYFNRGDVWREQLTVPDSGTSGHQITFGAYGSGADPIINGADLITGWRGYEFDDNFEANNFDKWDSQTTAGTNTITIDGGSEIDGTYSVKTTYDGTNEEAYTEIALPAGLADITVEFKFKTNVGFDLNDGFKRQAICALIDTGTVRAAAGLAQTTANVFAITGDLVNPYNVITSATTWTRGTTYTIKYRYVVDASVGGHEIWLNGVSQGSDFSGDTSNDEIDTICFGGYARGNTIISAGSIVYLDSLRITTDGIPNTDIYEKTAVTTEPTKAVVFDGTFGTKETSIANLDAANEWYWASNILYIYSSGGDPDVEYTTPGIEASERDYGISVDGKSYLDFSDISVKYTNIHGIYTTGNSDNHNYTDINSSYNGDNGFWSYHLTEHRDNYTFTDCTFSYNDACGLSHVRLTDDWTFTGCAFDYNCRSDDIASIAGYRYIASVLAGRGTNIVLTQCTAHDNGVGVTGGRGYGFWLDGPGSGSKITRCLAYDNYQAGVFIEYAYTDTSDIEATYNITYGNAYGVCLYRQSHDVKICNNVCYNNDYGLVIFGASDVGDDADMDDNIIKNNISYKNVNVNLIAKYGADNTGTGSGNIYSNNNLGPETDVGVAPTNLVEWGHLNYDDTYDDWETAYGGTTNSIELGPLMTDPGNDDFMLNPHSPCVNAGADVSLTEDYEGTHVPYGSAPDIGAYELAMEVMSIIMNPILNPILSPIIRVVIK